MSVLIIDAPSGCSGDMFVAALAQLADAREQITELPRQLGLTDVDVVFSDAVRSSIQAQKFDVYVQHTHGQTHADHHHDHEHRHVNDIKAMIQSACVSDGCKKRAIDIFERLGAVEAEAHGIPLEQVHFHEVGAIDSIIDIVAAALCLDLLQPTACYSSAICVGAGQVKTAHGVLPVPAPATERLLQGMPTFAGSIDGEWCTPTGAAILAHLQPLFEEDRALRSSNSAYGAGGKDIDQRPNVLRLRLAEAADSGADIHILYCNVDDMPPELLGADFCQSVIAAGARDVTIRPQTMKKGRPGFLIEVLCRPEDSQALSAFLCQHTSTIGVRIIDGKRYTLERRASTIECSYGSIAAKTVALPDGSERCLPEYDACAVIANKLDLPVLTIYNEALARAQK